MTPTREEVIRVARECGGLMFGGEPPIDCLFTPEILERLAQHFYEAGAAAEREPLSDEQIRKASLQAGMQEHYMGFHSGFLRFARTIEQAHGIADKQRCLLCNYQHGHAIGCANNPVDISLAKATGEKE